MEDSLLSPPIPASANLSRSVTPAADSRGVQLLLVILSVTAGSTDTIGFLGLNGLFTAHITGNLVILAARIVAGEGAQTAAMLSVPVFILMVVVTRALAGRMESNGVASLRPLLVLQFLLLAGFFILCVAARARINPDAPNAILAGMLGVCAMAVQNALVQISLKGAPATAAMTSNVTRFAMDVGEVLGGGDQAGVADARKNAARTLPPIIGFAVGCAVGGLSEARFGLRSLILAAGLALIACAWGFVGRHAASAGTTA